MSCTNIEESGTFDEETCTVLLMRNHELVLPVRNHAFSMISHAFQVKSQTLKNEEDCTSSEQ
jgi:hypothetical protein